MFVERLEPRLDLLREEYALVQAFKKTASYIRYHSWYSDTLALDLASANLRVFLDEIRQRLMLPETWSRRPLRIVPAPKSQSWQVRQGVWGPVKTGKTPGRLRPLAHVDLADQVVATALMLCLADRIETMQGDPRRDIHDPGVRGRVVSYGNRLFCDDTNGELRHRWGSSKLYRAYSQDYQTFVSRPEVAALSISPTEGQLVYVVHADLKQFYDRVRPDLLSDAIEGIQQADDDPTFFSLVRSVFDWRWHTSDERDVQIYAEQAELADFTRVVLPQGLVASGFFANVVLCRFDNALREAVGTEISAGIVLEDVCRYVDDFRIVVAVETTAAGLNNLGGAISQWLSHVLEEHASGLALSPEKTQVAMLKGNELPLVRQSAKMRRIQSAVSGGFDAIAGEEIVDALQGLMRSQEAASDDEGGWRLTPVPDVRDETVARFAAFRFRRTFRSIRPLLERDDGRGATRPDDVDELVDVRRPTRTQRELDEDARTFALGLVKRWV